MSILLPEVLNHLVYAASKRGNIEGNLLAVIVVTLSTNMRVRVFFLKDAAVYHLGFRDERESLQTERADTAPAYVRG